MTPHTDTITFLIQLDDRAYPALEMEAAAKGTGAGALARRQLITLRRLLDLDAHDTVTVHLVDEALHLTVPVAMLQATSG